MLRPDPLAPALRPSTRLPSGPVAAGPVAAGPAGAGPVAASAAAASLLAHAGLALAFAAAALPAAAAQDQTWYELGGSFVTTGDHWGESVALLPDVNSDGYADMIVGAPQDAGVGSAYMISGKAPHLLLKQFHGAGSGDTFGQVVALAGLVNGDSVPDVLVSAPREEVFTGFFVLTDAGVVTLYNGSSGAVLRTFLGTKAGARFGDSIASNADFTGDGVPDVLIGAPHWDKTDTTDNEGYASLYNGANGALLWRHEGADDGDLLGWSVAFVGDLTGDGRSEYAIGAPSDDVLSLTLPDFIANDAGTVTVYNGLTHLPLYTKAGFEGDGLGTAVCGVGDIDGDGQRELLVGAPRSSSDKGAAFLYEGSTGVLVRIFNGSNVGERFGTWLSKAGDVDKDGRQDLAIGGTEAGVPSGGGLIRVFDGGDGTLVKQHDFFTGSGVSQHASFDGGHDVNDDGWPDLLVGRPDGDTIASNAGGAECIGQLHYQPDLGFQGPHLATFSIFGGKLKTGSKADFELTGVPFGGQPFLMLSAGLGLTSFKGGTLVPKLAGSLLLTFPPLHTGSLTIPAFPGGGGPANFYAQFIITGYAGSEPIGLTNALIIQLLP